MATKVERKLPPYITVCGVPYYIEYCDDELQAADLISRSSLADQRIHILSKLPFARQCRLLCSEVAWQLLNAAGVDMDKCTQYNHNVGNTLHNFIKSNNLVGISQLNEMLPDNVIIGDIKYTVHIDRNDHLDDVGLDGEIVYDDLAINVNSRLAAIAKRVIACHEIAHGMLYESGMLEDMNNESIITPLGFFLYLFIRDNEFDFMKGV